jgi:hypothetical protein
MVDDYDDDYDAIADAPWGLIGWGFLFAAAGACFAGHIAIAVLFVIAGALCGLKMQHQVYVARRLIVSSEEQPHEHE